MSRLVASFVLYGMATIVLSENCIFDFDDFLPLGESEKNIIDLTGQQISALVEGNDVLHYITGPIKVKEDVTYSFKVRYLLQNIFDEGILDVAAGVRDACFFFDNVYNKYLLPIVGSHNDFPPEAEVCPIEPFSAKLLPARSRDDLVGPSKLATGKYYCEVLYLKNEKPVGGFIANFTVLRD